MFEIIIIALCLVIIALLIRLGLLYRKMDDERVLRYTSARAVFKGCPVEVQDAARYAGRHRILYHAISAAYFLIAMALTVATIYHVVNTHSWYQSYVRVTSDYIMVDTKLFLGVLMILSFWAVFIVLLYAGRRVTNKESEVLDRMLPAGKNATSEDEGKEAG